MTKLSDEEYERLKKFMGLFYEWFTARDDAPPEIHPVAVLNEIVAKSRSNAKRGIIMAINDIAEDTTHWPPDAVSAADKLFAANDAPSLSEIRAKYSKNYAKILKRGKIKSEEEYYVIKGIVDGVLEAGAPESEKLSAMLEDFESRIVPGSMS